MTRLRDLRVAHGRTSLRRALTPRPPHVPCGRLSRGHGPKTNLFSVTDFRGWGSPRLRGPGLGSGGGPTRVTRDPPPREAAQAPPRRAPHCTGFKPSLAGRRPLATWRTGTGKSDSGTSRKKVKVSGRRMSTAVVASGLHTSLSELGGSLGGRPTG